MFCSSFVSKPSWTQHRFHTKLILNVQKNEWTSSPSRWLSSLSHSWTVFDDYTHPTCLPPVHLVVLSLCTTYHNQRHSFSFWLGNHGRAVRPADGWKTGVWGLWPAMCQCQTIVASFFFCAQVFKVSVAVVVALAVADNVTPLPGTSAQRLQEPKRRKLIVRKFTALLCRRRHFSRLQLNV